jgi:hypothetical protein
MDGDIKCLAFKFPGMEPFAKGEQCNASPLIFLCRLRPCAGMALRAIDTIYDKPSCLLVCPFEKDFAAESTADDDFIIGLWFHLTSPLKS